MCAKSMIQADTKRNTTHKATHKPSLASASVRIGYYLFAYKCFAKNLQTDHRKQAFSVWELRVISLLPSAAEIIAIVGAADSMVARSHEDDYPTSIVHLPAVTSSRVKFTSCADIDKQVTSVLGKGEALYALDGETVKRLNPTHIVTQDICQVCSIDLGKVGNVRALEDVISDIREVADALGLKENDRMENAKKLAASVRPAVLPKVLFLEWTDPPFDGPHTPELVDWANGKCNKVPGDMSKRLTPEEVIEQGPYDLIIVCPCGLNLQDSIREVKVIEEKEEWWRKVSREAKKVAILDGNQYFNRPGPRLVDAFEWMVGFINDQPQIIPSDFIWQIYHPSDNTL
ncbi:hypothetical protein PROFUN_14696 [Planoprotostelium fungivorum]|uniref:Fe/B12 periplasmic-binding domain-containing protein n=1 Tax=Planoprotostelium fungivorum TaxID=1890364 RepID=A0A2P6MZ72_9EUKA|nr:hypothetical protein PROFUN_14696 [Planoprotostelium fungivorum]